MNQCTVLPGSIVDKYNDAAFSVSQAVPMETFRVKQKLPVIWPFSQSLPWLLDLYFSKENDFHTLGYESKGPGTFPRLENVFPLPDWFS